MIRKQIQKDIEKATEEFMVHPSDVRAGSSLFAVSTDQVEVARSADPGFGDYTTNVAMRIRFSALGSQLSDNGRSVGQLTGKQKTEKLQSDNRKQRTDNKQSPMEIAKKLADSLQDLPYIKKLEVKEPGFINFWIKDEIWQKEVGNVLEVGSGYGSNDSGSSKKARVEFVSANPTGPLHFGNARGGPIGDALASVLEFSGYRVVREYYNNDVGVQVYKLGESIINVKAGKPLLDQEYKGEYIKSLADQLDSVKTTQEAGEKAVEILSKEAVDDCKMMGIGFDEVHKESDFLNKGLTEKAIKELSGKNFIKESEGAKWFATGDEFLKDRETVVVKSDKSYTYFATDIAYHKFKFEAGPALVIDIFGANHHGHVPRLKAAVSALGFDVSTFHVILYQWVRFFAGGEVAKMSKRAGTLLTAREVLGEVGADAVRFFILSYDPNSPIDFDLALAKKKSKDNPVYYVQYAHARIASILSKAEGLTTNAKQLPTTNYSLLTTSFELALIKKITELPELVEEIARSFAVHRLTRYAIDLADLFHKFYENCPVISDAQELMQARLALCRATQIALANTFSLLGVSAPEKM